MTKAPPSLEGAISYSKGIIKEIKQTIGDVLKERSP